MKLHRWTDVSARVRARPGAAARIERDVEAARAEVAERGEATLPRRDDGEDGGRDGRDTGQAQPRSI
jgi:hypothetical protein